MKHSLKGIIICVVAFMILNMASACYAQNMGKKLYRGVANIATGWIELPKNAYNAALEYDFASAVFIGLSKGCWMAIVRTSVGVYDTLTFPFPIPKGYGPLLEPEFVFKK
jgi:putative exosortase-associated protein (TIGR04073 family)